mgnify:CR=1 FL=1
MWDISPPLLPYLHFLQTCAMLHIPFSLAPLGFLTMAENLHDNVYPPFVTKMGMVPIG